MKKLLIAAILILAGIILFRQVFMPAMAPKIFERAVSENIGIDRSADLPDGLHVYICGAGSPLPDLKRSGSCIGILAGRKAFIIDAGSGSVRNLNLMGFPVDRVDQIYLTHTHSDHFDELGEALLLAWISGSRTSPLPVAGPLGTTHVVNGFNAAYAWDAKFRTAHHGPKVANPAGFGGAGYDIDLTDGRKVLFENTDLKITATTVSHEPVSPAFGYRIDYKDRSIYISGDTSYDSNIAGYAKDVDVLFHEALNKDMVHTMEKAARQNGAENLATVFGDILDYHVSPVEAAKTAADAGAENLVIYHAVPPLPADALKGLFMKGVDKAYDGKAMVSEDGTIVRLPAQSDKIIYEHGL